MTTPSTNGSNGRDVAGRFAAGNRGGPGNPYAKRSAAGRGIVRIVQQLDSVLTYASDERIE